jgi:hypothetical protein
MIAMFLSFLNGGGLSRPEVDGRNPKPEFNSRNARRKGKI